MKTPIILFAPFVAVVFTLLSPAPSRADVIHVSGDTYAAIAYSEKTGKWGYGYNYSTRRGAEAEALRKCTADDAKIVTWVHNGFCALAVGEKVAWGIGYTYGDGASSRTAKLTAINECKKRSSTAKLLLCICSYDVTPEVFDK